jgi:glycosyltransferase involved in cell wall biosynthesis
MRLALASNFNPADGLGGLAARLADALDASGHRIDRIDRGDYHAISIRASILLTIDTADALDRLDLPAVTVAYAMYESDTLPPGWADALNRCQHIITPTTFCEQLFRAEGVRVPITIIPAGTNPAYHPILRKSVNPRGKNVNPGITTLIVGTLNSRKNWDLGVEAWQRVAGPDDRLILKTNRRHTDYRPDDPRITVHTDPTDGDLMAWYGKADLLLAIGSEGYGLPLYEAMATGLPCIVGDYAGHHDAVADGAPVLSVPSGGMRDNINPHVPNQVGRCHYPDVDALSEQIALLSGDAELRQRLGRASRQWVKQHRSHGQFVARIIETIEAVPTPDPVQIRKPLRVCVEFSGGGVGDSVLAVPALRAIRQTYPNAHITYRSRLDAAQWLLHRGLVDAIGHDSDPLPACDVLLCFSQRPQATRREQRNHCRTVWTAPRFAPVGIHQAHHYYRQVKQAMPIWAPYDEQPMAVQKDPRSAETIILAPGSSDTAKVWPHFDQLRSWLIHTGHDVITIGPETGTVSEVGRMVESARLVIGNDSWATHAAGATGTPGIVLFGPSQPRTWAPIGTSVRILHGCPQLSRSFAWTGSVVACTDGDCWDLLPLERVQDAVAEMLGAPRIIRPLFGAPEPSGVVARLPARQRVAVRC